MTTKYEKLQNLYNEKQNISGLRRSNLRNSVAALLSDGFTRTGSSGWISVRRGASKEIWTQEISDILTNVGIEHECGNDAPRGGANGEYVKVTSPAFVKAVKKAQADRKARWEEEKRIAAEKEAIAKAQREAHRQRMNELVEENIDKFMALDFHSLLPLHANWEGRYYFTKKGSTAAARIISETTGVDFQTCIWFVRGDRFNEIMNK
jgi:hypothetical protein